MEWLYTTSVIVHVLAACTWVGALVFFAAVVVPTIRRAEYAPVRATLVGVLGRRFRILGWTALGILVTTGASNLLLRGIGFDTLGSPAFWRTGIGHALAWKLVFVALALASTAAHDFYALRSRQASSWLGRATLLFSMGAVAFAVYLVRGIP